MKNYYQKMRDETFREINYWAHPSIGWLQLTPKGSYKNVGWKFRLSMHPDDVTKAWNITVDTLITDSKTVHCAKVAQPETIQRLSNPNEPQAGKMITIYTEEKVSPTHYMHIMQILEEKLHAANILTGLKVAGDRKVPGAKFLSYRNAHTQNGKYNCAINNVGLSESQKYNPTSILDPYVSFVIDASSFPSTSLLNQYQNTEAKPTGKLPMLGI